MFWDRDACAYDVFSNALNRKTHKELCTVVAKRYVQRMKFLRETVIEKPLGDTSSFQSPNQHSDHSDYMDALFVILVSWLWELVRMPYVDDVEGDDLV